MDVGSLDKITKKDVSTGKVRAVGQLTAKVIFDLIFVIIYIVILVVLFLALFARFVVLWIYMVISPVF
jgi:hypothetical protein